MKEKFVEKIRHEEEGKIKTVKGLTEKEDDEKIEQEKKVYDSERAID